MRLLLDELFSPRIAAELRSRGHDVISALEVEILRSQPDQVVFEWARRESRAVVTDNVPDFVRHHGECLGRGDHHFGLVLSRNKSLPRLRGAIGPFVRALDALLASMPDVNALRDGISWLSLPLS